MLNLLFDKKALVMPALFFLGSVEPGATYLFEVEIV